jgi:RNA polymerase sigma-70 factor (ECF subfamily)
MAGALTNRPRPAASEQVGDETELVARAKRDRQAFAPLYARYFDPIYRYCYRRLGNTEAAADATSQTFAKALAALPSCREDTFRSWLFAIAHNVLTDSYRAHRPDRPLNDALDLPDDAPSPEELAVGAEARGRIVRLLDQLVPDQRRILELRLAGLTSKEIAAALGRTPNAVDQAQFRALTRLRTLLSAAERGPEEAR